MFSSVAYTYDILLEWQIGVKQYVHFTPSIYLSNMYFYGHLCA